MTIVGPSGEFVKTVQEKYVPLIMTLSWTDTGWKLATLKGTGP